MRRTCTAAAAILFVLLLGSTPAHAQTVQGGIKGGVSFSTLEGLGEIIGDLPAVDTEHKINWVFGAFIKVNLAQFFAIQPEVLYVRKGAKLALTGAFRDTASVTLDYIDIPVLARLQTSRGTGLYLLVGPSFGVNVTAEAEAPDGTTEDVKDGVKTGDVGMVFGGGVDLAHFIVEGRYTQGLSNIAQDAPAETSIKNRSLSLLFGIRF